MVWFQYLAKWSWRCSFCSSFTINTFLIIPTMIKNQFVIIHKKIKLISPTEIGIPGNRLLTEDYELPKINLCIDSFSLNSLSNQKWTVLPLTLTEEICSSSKSFRSRIFVCCSIFESSTLNFCIIENGISFLFWIILFYFSAPIQTHSNKPPNK